MKQTPPAKIILRFLRSFCHRELLEDIEGDVLELYYRRQVKSKLLGQLILLKDVILLCRPGIVRNLTFGQNSIIISMFKNYFRSAWRNLLKYKSFSIINISSLALGIATCIVVALFILDEHSFDSLHQKNVYRLCEVQSFPGTKVQKVALSMPGMGPTMLEEFPEIENYTRYWSFGEQLVELADKKLMVEKVRGVDSMFFSVFDFELLHGTRNDLIKGKEDAVLTRDMAILLFDQVDVVGKTFAIDEHQFQVKGVIENVSENSHLQFEMLLSVAVRADSMEEFNSAFGSNYVNTYLILNEQTDIAYLESKFPDYMRKMAAAQSPSSSDDPNDYYVLFLQALDEVHLGSTDIEHDYNNYRKFNGEYINIFILVGVLILIIAAVNFTNLTTARASTRSKEVGVRKTVGAFRSNLFQQFLFESILLSYLALVLALLLVLVALPMLNQAIDRSLTLIGFINQFEYLVYLVLIVSVIGLIAGLYPAVYISSFKPVLILKGLNLNEKKSLFRSSLVVLQFSLALGMIVSTLIITDQMLFIKNKDVGFTKDHILLVDMNRQSNEHYQSIKEELLKKSNVLGVTASGQRLGNNFHQWGYKVAMDTGITDGVTPSNVHVDYDYLDVYEIDLVEGRDFSKDYATDEGLAFIINEAFAQELGFEDAVGKRVGLGWYPDDSLGTIIGVTKNFNFNSLHHRINTLSIVIQPDWGYSEMSVKLNGQNIAQGIREVEEVYSQFVTDFPIDYEFLDDHFEELYKADQQMGFVVTIIAVLSVIIGCIGLLGLASITIQRRMKEVGIRKVMGASSGQLWIMLSKSFALMILLSFAIATPVTLIFMTNWLSNFAFRVSINPLLFLAGGLVSLVIALATVSYHVITAVRANPVKSLRYE